MHVGQPHVAARKAERETRMVKSQQVQHRGVQVVNFDFILDDFVTIFIGLPVNRPSLDSSASQP